MRTCSFSCLFTYVRVGFCLLFLLFFAETVVFLLLLSLSHTAIATRFLMSSGVSHLLPIHIQNEPIKHDPVGFGKHKSSLLRLCDLTLCAFVLAPLSICNWATTWDIAYYYMFNGSEADPATGVDANASAVASAATTATLNNGGETNSASSNGISDDLKFYYSILFTFIVSNVIIALTYVFQHDLQSYHDYLEHHRRRRSTKQHERAKGGDGYYGYDFLFRSLYTYVITTAYVLQWRTYWDLLEHWSTNISWKHSLPVSVFALLFHRYVLKTSLGSFSKTVPFYLVKDLQFEKFFLQSNDFKFRNVSHHLASQMNVTVVHLCFYLFNFLCLCRNMCRAWWSSCTTK